MLTVAPENVASRNSVTPSENVAWRKSTVAPANVALVKVTVPSENVAPSEVDRAAGETRPGEVDGAAGELRVAEVDRGAGEPGASEVASVKGGTGEVEGMALPRVRMVGEQTQVVADDADDGVPHFPQGQVGMPRFRIVRWQVGFLCVRQAEVGAQHIDAGLAQLASRCIVGQPGQGVHGAQAHSLGVVAQLADGIGETLGVQTGGLAQSAVLVDALAPVGNDQSDKSSGCSNHPEGQLG